MTCGIAVPSAGAADLVAGAPDPAQVAPVEPVTTEIPAPEGPAPSVEPLEEIAPETTPAPVQQVSPEPVNDVVPVAVAAEESSASVEEAAELAQPAVADLGSAADRATQPVDHGLESAIDSPGATVAATQLHLEAAPGPADSALGIAAPRPPALDTGSSEVSTFDSAIRGPVRELKSGLAPALSGPPAPDPVFSPASALPSGPVSGTPGPKVNPTAADPAAGRSAPAASVLAPLYAPATGSLDVAPGGQAPASPQALGPGKAPESPSGAGGPPSGGFFFFTFAAMLLGLLVLAGQAASRRIRSAPVCWRPVPFVSLLERPG